MIGTIDLASLGEKTPEDLYRSLKTQKTGLSQAEALRRLKTYGPNEFAGRKKLQPVAIFLSKFKSPLLLLLVVAAVVSGLLGSRFEAGIILVIVFGSAIIDFVNTYKSTKAAEDLQEKVNITAAVMRGGTLKERNMREVVPGDIFVLQAGDLVPADGVLLEAKDLFLNESVLTGESMPAEKEVGQAPAARTVYLGTSVVAGTGTGVAVATGGKTKVGSIAGGLKKPDAPTEFERNIRDFSLFIFRITIFLVLAVILFNVLLLRRDPLQIFLFAVAIAIGITPELLPLIITSNLAKGALKMSENGVIVKKLAAIHNFGGVDVLCTDKTGTLTEDRIALMRSVDGFGKDDEEVFFWGYVSSKCRGGIAKVLEKAIENWKKIDMRGWEKLDEVPFDAVRRMESVIVKKGSEAMLIAKGAPEDVMKVADRYGSDGKELAPAMREKFVAEYEALSKDGFRVLGVAVKKVPLKTKPYERSDEKGLSFLGFLAFFDPPKKTVKETLKRMAEHRVAIKIITGDNFFVTQKVAREIGLAIEGALAGEDLAALDDAELGKKAETANVFTRVAPEMKERIIRALRKNGHVVAYMGDGVNDLLSLKEADVGISVQNAVDIAKETADIILLRRGLHEIIEGIVEGRRTFANTFKYLMMSLSSNFGNMFSMPVASVALPFLPMTAPQILLNNFLYDASQLAIPFDNVEADFLARPKKFDIQFMKKFMIIFGPLSSCFDLITFAALVVILRAGAGVFQTGWFIESIATQTLVVGIVRNRGTFRKTPPSFALALAAPAAVAAGWLIPYSPLGPLMGFVPLGVGPLVLIAFVVAAYLFAVESAKTYFYRKYGALIEK